MELKEKLAVDEQINQLQELRRNILIKKEQCEQCLQNPSNKTNDISDDTKDVLQYNYSRHEELIKESKETIDRLTREKERINL